MQRSTFIGALGATVGLSQLCRPAPALAAIDEAEIGRQVFAQLRDNGDLLFDSSYYEHLNEIGSVIASTVRDRYPYPIRYYVVRGDSANAFSVPGGNIYVNEPLLDMAKNRDELAGVLAHETGHMVLHHVAKQMSRMNAAGTAASIGSLIAQILLGPIVGGAVDYATQYPLAHLEANTSKHIEAQADEEGARIMAASKTFNPWGMVWFFQIMSEAYGPGQANWLIDHPIFPDRIADLEHEIASNPAVFGAWKDTKQKDAVYW